MSYVTVAERGWKAEGVSGDGGLSVVKLVDGLTLWELLLLISVRFPLRNPRQVLQTPINSLP